MCCLHSLIVTLSGNITVNSIERFKGFLIQTRTVADNSLTGEFVVMDEMNTKLSSCSPSSVRYSMYSSMRTHILYTMLTVSSSCFTSKVSQQILKLVLSLTS